VSYDSNVYPLLSIIIPTYDPTRCGDVIELLESLSNQSYRRIEVIVVTESLFLGNSIKNYIKRAGLQNVQVIVDQSLKGVNESRNRGINKAKGDFIALLDDDVVVSVDWAYKIVETHLLIRNTGAVTGPAYPLWTGKGAEWIPKEMYWLISCTGWNWQGLKEVRNVGGMNSSYHKDSIFRVSLFNPTIGPVQGGAKAGKVLYVGAEEIELCTKLRHHLKKLVVYNPEAFVYHKVNDRQTTFTSLTKRAVHFGFTRGYVYRYLSYDRDPALSFETQHFITILSTFLHEIGAPNLNFSSRMKRVMIYPVAIMGLLVGFFSFFILG
jgi:glycosyltransferase involved in cell wall biosynthesis